MGSPNERRRERKEVDPDLNLLPMMNLITLLIPFLLMSAQFVTLAIIDSSLPAIGQPQPSDEKKDDKPPLSLTVGITEEGFTIAGSATVLGCDKGAAAAGMDGVDAQKCTTIPMTNDGAYCGDLICKGDPNCNAAHVTPCHDQKALHDLMIQLKEFDGDADGKADYGEPCSPPDPKPEGWQPPETCNVIIAPNPNVPYYAIIGVMDATREYKKEGESETLDLFPYVVIAGGVK